MKSSIGHHWVDNETFSSYEEADRLVQLDPTHWKVTYSFKKHAYVLKERNPSAN